MGFTTNKSNILLGLGVSAFSYTPKAHLQNEKILESYTSALNKNRFPILKSHQMTHEEKNKAKLFEQIICQGFFEKTDAENVLSEQKDHFYQYEKDGFFHFQNNRFEVSDLGKYFLKNICQCWG